VFKAGEFHKLRDLPKVMRFIWNFDRVNRPLIEQTREAHGPTVPVVRLSGDRQLDKFVRDQIQA
jgi:hypothetical protein